MSHAESPVARVSHFIHKRFLLLLIGTYAIAACFPTAGLLLRDVSLGKVSLFGGSTRMTLSMLMLSSLLLNAGLGIRLDRLRGLLLHPRLLGFGLAANLFIPVAFILSITQLMGAWHSPDEVQTILVGLALVGSMPIAGSSTAWAQNADGEMALSLGLVLASTFLSPLTTPVVLHAVGFMATGDYAQDLHQLAAGGSGAFLGICVLVPSVLGIGLRRAIGDTRITAAGPGLKLINSIILLTLNYSNAAVSLPQAIRHPDWDFLGATLLIVASLCALAFSSGWAIARFLGATHGQRASLMFGLGMNNNGTGLVLASLALADHPRVMLPIIFYNLIQHLAAGFVDRFGRPAETGQISGKIRTLPALRNHHGVRDVLAGSSR